MIRKRLLSACLALALCLGLLPVTALAAGPNTVYVGGEALAGSSDSIVYAITNESGEVVKDGANANNYNIKWDGSTLTLRNATIKESVSTDTSTFIAGAAIGVLNQNGDANLTITLEGTNTIAEVGNGICVLAHNESTGNASLTIMGNGSLTASVSVNSGILVQSNGGNATLTIQNADVTAENSSSSGDGVTVRAGSSSSASLSVNGGSLTATGSGTHGAGIRFLFGSSDSSSRTPSLNVSNSAIVKASGDTGGITSNSSPVTPSGTGIVFNNGTGTVYGSVTLQENLTIGEGESLTLAENASLSAGSHNVIVDGGTLGEGFNLGDSVKYTPTITTNSLPGGSVGTDYSQPLTADGSGTITWRLAAGSSLPDGLSLNCDGTITGTPTTAGTYSFTVTATNDYGSDSKEFTLIIDQQGTIHVTSVSLDKTSLE